MSDIRVINEMTRERIKDVEYKSIIERILGD
jgi:hypothetical protein